jgi:hypothetical protein
MFLFPIGWLLVRLYPHILSSALRASTPIFEENVPF